MSSSAVRRTALPIALRSMLWALLALLAAAAQAATGLAEIRRQQGQELVAVFYPTEAEGPPVQRWQFSLPLV